MSFNKKFFTTGGIVASSPSGYTNPQTTAMLFDEIWDYPSGAQIQNGGLTAYFPNNNEGTAFPNVNPISSGKWYMEFEMDYTQSTGAYIGITDYDNYTRSGAKNTFPNDAGSALKSMTNNGTLYYGNGYTDSLAGATSTWSNGQIISIALDADNSTCTFARNGSWMLGYTPSTSNVYTNFSWTNTQIWVAHGSQSSLRRTTWKIVPDTSLNYSVPSGYTALKGDFTASQTVY